MIKLLIVLSKSSISKYLHHPKQIFLEFKIIKKSIAIKITKIKSKFIPILNKIYEKKKTKIIPLKQFIPSAKFIALISNKKQRHVKIRSNGKSIL